MSKPQRQSGPLLNRREAIERVAAAGMGMLVAGGPRSAGVLHARASQTASGARAYAPSWKTEFKQLAPNVFAYQQGGGPGVPSSGVSNGGVIVGPDHWMAIDAFAAPPPAKAMIAAARQVTNRPCGRLVNTHHHADHTTGNSLFLPAEIVGTEYCRQAVVRGGLADLKNRPESWRVGAAELRLAPPSVTFDGKVTYRYGDIVVELIGSGPAHTYGDLLVYLPQQRILFAGDIAFHYIAPAGQSALISGWIQTISRIEKMDVDVIVPGHGPIGTKKDLAAMREYLEILTSEARRRFDAGMTPGRAAAELESVMRKYEDWIDPAANRVPASTARLYAEFRGILTPQREGDTAALMRETNEEFNKVKAASR